jgi:hypothetical protein
MTSTMNFFSVAAVVVPPNDETLPVVPMTPPPPPLTITPAASEFSSVAVPSPQFAISAANARKQNIISFFT